MHSPDDILDFWFPDPPASDHETMARRLEWWFRGGTDPHILERFADLPGLAARGTLDQWADHARSRLALILVLDQFSRSVYRGSPLAYANDEKARSVAREGMHRGHYIELGDPWYKTFFLMPLGHSEDLEDLQLAVQLTALLPFTAPQSQRRLLEHSADQARSHRDVVARFGRQPHRNEILGRSSTPEETEYLATVTPVHQRAVPHRDAQATVPSGE